MNFLAAAPFIGLEQDAFVTLIIGLLAAPIVAVVTYLLSRPKQRSDVHASMVSSASTAVDTIADVLQEVRNELEEARGEIAALREENQTLRVMVDDLKKQISELHLSST